MFDEIVCLGQAEVFSVCGEFAPMYQTPHQQQQIPHHRAIQKCFAFLGRMHRLWVVSVLAQAAKIRPFVQPALKPTIWKFAPTLARHLILFQVSLGQIERFFLEKAPPVELKG